MSCLYRHLRAVEAMRIEKKNASKEQNRIFPISGYLKGRDLPERKEKCGEHNEHSQWDY